MPRKDPIERAAYKAAYDAEYRVTHREKTAARRAVYRKAYRGASRAAAIRKITEHRKRPVECMWDITPDYRTFKNPCAGPIQIDHIHGRGIKDYEEGSVPFYLAITGGRIDLNELRLLCRYHNRWNAHRPFDEGRWNRERKSYMACTECGVETKRVPNGLCKRCHSRLNPGANT